MNKYIVHFLGGGFTAIDADYKEKTFLDNIWSVLFCNEDTPCDEIINAFPVTQIERIETVSID